jgi:short-subunit dehydrogenase
LAKQKINLFLIGRNLEKLEGLKDEIISKITNEIKVVCLISEASDSSIENIENLFFKIDETLPTGHFIRILINNVGMGQNGKRRLGDIEISVEGGLFEEIVKVNCIYPVILTRAFLKRLKGDNGHSAIINVASCAALTPATPFSSLYAATKSFNRSFSMSLSGELSVKHLLHPESTPKIDVICVNPGFVVSNMTKMKESAYCCSAQDHSHIVFSKISQSWPLSSVDIIPHWKHGLMWSILAVLEILIPSEWFLVAFLMPVVLKLSGKFRNFDIKE